MLTIWGRLNSHNVKKVAWLAAELDLPHERIDVGGPFGMDAAYLARNPNALIPTIDDDGFVLWESNAILRYLAAKHGGDRWWPADPARRAFMDRWMDWNFAFQAVQRPAFWGLVRTAEADRDMAEINRAAVEAGRLMGVLDDHLARDAWLSGDDFGVGDIPMGVYVHTWFALPIDRPARPHVARWYAALQERPAFRDTVMIPLT